MWRVEEFIPTFEQGEIKQNPSCKYERFDSKLMWKTKTK